jgi:hypothetical protein
MAKPEINKKENNELKPVEAPNYKVRKGLFLYTRGLMGKALIDSEENLMRDEERSEIILANTKVLKNFLTKGWSCDSRLDIDTQKEIIAVGMVEHGGHFDQDLIDFVQSTNKPRKVFLKICDALNMRMHIKERFEGEIEQLCKEWELAGKLENYYRDYVYPEPVDKRDLAERVDIQLDENLDPIERDMILRDILNCSDLPVKDPERQKIRYKE